MDAVTRTSQSFSYPEDQSVSQPESVSGKIKSLSVRNSLNHCVSTLAHQTDIALRAITQYSWCPFKGAIQYNLPNMVTHGDLVIPNKVSGDTAVLLINNNHSAILLGGYDSDILMNPQYSNSKGCQENVFSWHPVHPPYTPPVVVEAAAGSIITLTIQRITLHIQALL